MTHCTDILWSNGSSEVHQQKVPKYHRLLFGISNYICKCIATKPVQEVKHKQNQQIQMKWFDLIYGWYSAAMKHCSQHEYSAAGSRVRSSEYTSLCSFGPG